jgi:RNA polymerase sigma-70 factor (ECF subfamily)
MSNNADTPEQGETVDLARRVARGDRAAEELLVRKYSGRILAMVIARTRDREAARELANDALMVTVQALRNGTIRDTGRLGAFIHGTAVNLINNRLRVNSRQPPMDALSDDLPGPDGAELIERDSDLTLLHRGIAGLDPRDRQVLTLTLVNGLGPGDIARRTGLTEEAVRQRKSRALKRLRELLTGPSRSGDPGPLDVR